MSNLAVIACASPLSMRAPICLNSVRPAWAPTRIFVCGFQIGFLIEGIEPKKYVFQDEYAGRAFE
jgi:hypothetical protein